MKYPGFWPHQIGAHIVGTPFTSRGVVCGLSARNVTSQPNTAFLSWSHHKDGVNPEAHCFLVHVNGVYNTKETSPNALLGGLRPGVPYEFDVLPTTGVEEITIEDSKIFYKPNRGNRCKLSWAENTTDDFDSYLIYYDNGLEDGNADTLLDVITGRANTVYVTPVLEDKEYTFKITYRDQVGNVAAVDGPAHVVQIDSYPKAPDNPALVYSQVTRKVTLSASVPVGQSADVVGYAIYSNYVPAFGLHPALCLERWLRLAEVTDIAGAISFITYELFGGTHRFAIRAVDKSGAESDFTELIITLVKSGGDLIEAPVQPNAPEMIDAEAQAGGKILLTARLIDLDNVTAIRFYQDGVQINETPYIAGQFEYTFQTNALTDGQSYDFTAKVLNTSTLSESSNTLNQTADGSAPTGDKVLSCEVVF